jgi:ribose 5-phosphate isomerase
LRRQAAAYVADTYLSSGQVVGLGTGVAVNIILHELAERLGDGRLRVRPPRLGPPRGADP